MDKVHKRIMAKFHEFLLWLGVPKHLHNDYRAHQICKIISEFSLEFRTTRERGQQVEGSGAELRLLLRRRRGPHPREEGLQLPDEVFLAGAHSGGHWRLEYHPDLIFLHDSLQTKFRVDIINKTDVNVY